MTTDITTQRNAPFAASRRGRAQSLSGRVESRRFGTAVGPVRHVAEDRDRLAAMQWEHFDVKQYGATIGAELHGVDLTVDLDDDTIAEIRAALCAYKVIFFRDQFLTTEQHVGFARRFGELEVHPFIPANADYPELVQLAKGPEMAGYENGWHSDVSWRIVPSMGAVLRAVEVPASGGDTLFADMCAAYDGLDDDMKERIADMYAIHDYMFVFGRFVPEDKRAETRAQFPPARHPVVRTHPETGRKILYVNRGFVDYIEGFEREESDALLQALASQAELPEYQCRFHWEPGSIAFWDNRAVQHYAASDYFPHRRVMERASIIGDRPV
ncbi:MAG TPA: TauD/TfdA family dioxygenase [Acidimicrobiia bacterium]